MKSTKDLEKKKNIDRMVLPLGKLGKKKRTGGKILKFQADLP